MLCFLFGKVQITTLKYSQVWITPRKYFWVHLPLHYIIWFNLPFNTICLFYFSMHKWNFEFNFCMVIAENIRHVKKYIS
jgi:hypothetical protein